jgi:RNA polymerase sigma factor (sigma-70 family)
VASADDLAQEAFVRLYRRVKSLEERDRLTGYVYRTVLNLARKHHRGHRRREAREGRFEHGHARDRVAEVDARDEIWQRLLRLPLRQRAALYLRYYEDLSEEGAAHVLGCSVSAVKSLTNHGLAALRTQIAEEATR